MTGRPAIAGNASDDAAPPGATTEPGRASTSSEAERLARGTCRALAQLGYASLLEVPLADGGRADILALGRSGDLVIIEIKTSIADFRGAPQWGRFWGLP